MDQGATSAAMSYSCRRDAATTNVTAGGFTLRRTAALQTHATQHGRQRRRTRYRPTDPLQLSRLTHVALLFDLFADMFALLLLVAPLARSSSRMTAHVECRVRLSLCRRRYAGSSSTVVCSPSSSASTSHDLIDHRQPSSLLCCCYLAASSATPVRLRRVLRGSTERAVSL